MQPSGFFDSSESFGEISYGADDFNEFLYDLFSEGVFFDNQYDPAYIGEEPLEENQPFYLSISEFSEEGGEEPEPEPEPEGRNESVQELISLDVMKGRAFYNKHWFFRPYESQTITNQDVPVGKCQIWALCLFVDIYGSNISSSLINISQTNSTEGASLSDCEAAWELWKAGYYEQNPYGFVYLTNLAFLTNVDNVSLIYGSWYTVGRTDIQTCAQWVIPKYAVPQDRSRVLNYMPIAVPASLLANTDNWYFDSKQLPNMVISAADMGDPQYPIPYYVTTNAEGLDLPSPYKTSSYSVTVLYFPAIGMTQKYPLQIAFPYKYMSHNSPIYIRRGDYTSNMPYWGEWRQIYDSINIPQEKILAESAFSFGTSTGNEAKLFQHADGTFEIYLYISSMDWKLDTTVSPAATFAKTSFMDKLRECVGSNVIVQIPMKAVPIPNTVRQLGFCIEMRFNTNTGYVYGEISYDSNFSLDKYMPRLSSEYHKFSRPNTIVTDLNKNELIEIRAR